MKKMHEAHYADFHMDILEGRVDEAVTRVEKEEEMEGTDAMEIDGGGEDS